MPTKPPALAPLLKRIAAAGCLAVALFRASPAHAGSVTLNDGSTLQGTVILAGTTDLKLTLQQTAKPLRTLKFSEIRAAVLDAHPGDTGSREADGVPWSRTELGDAKKAGAADLNGNKITITDSSDGFRLGRPRRPDDVMPGDSCCFVFQKLEGDGEIVAKVLPSETTKWMRAGLLISEGLDGDGTMAYVARTADPVAAIFFSRAVGRRTGQSVLAASADARDVPVGIPWLKLTRTGDLFKAFESPDGVKWSPVGEPRKIPMDESKGVYIGVAATGNSREGTAAFEAIKFTGKRAAAALTGVGDARLPDISVTLQDGTVLAGTLETLNAAGEAKIKRSAPGAEPVTLPLAALARAQFAPLTRAQTEKFLASTGGLLTRDGDFLDGDIKELKADSVTVSSVTFGLTNIEKWRAFGLVFPAPANAKPEPGLLQVHLQDGSLIMARKMSLDKDQLVIEGPLLGTFRTPLKEALSIERRD